MRLNEASAIIDIIDGRVKAQTGSMAQVDMTYGQVASIGSDGTASAYVYGAATPSPYFRPINGFVPKAGDAVRLAMNGAGDRWVEEVIPSAYYPMQFDVTGGVINWGPYSTGVTDTNLYRSGAATLATDSQLSVNNVNGVRVIAASGNHSFRTFLLSSDTQPVLEVASNGTLQWGPGGSTAYDTDLYRVGVSTLQTSHHFTALGNVTVGGTLGAGSTTVTGLTVNGAGIVTGTLTVGTLNVGNGTTQQFQIGGGSMELWDNNNPFIDWKTNSAHDFDWRMIYDFSNDGWMDFNIGGSGAGLRINMSTSVLNGYLNVVGPANTTIPGSPALYIDEPGGTTGQTVVMYRVSNANKAFTRVDNTGNFVISPQGGNTYISWDNGGAIMLGQTTSQYVKAPGMPSTSAFRGGTSDNISIAVASTYYNTPNSGSVNFTPTWVGQPWLIIANCAIGGNNSTGYSLMKTSVQQSGTDIAVMGYGRAYGNQTTHVAVANVWVADRTSTCTAVSMFTSGTTGTISVDYHGIVAIPLMG